MTNSVCVLKFGGTSVGNGERIRQVASIIVNTLHDPDEAFPVVVVSAMSGVTDQLLRIARFACSGDTTACEQELLALRKKHSDAAEIIVQDTEKRTILLCDLEQSLHFLSQDVHALS